MTVRIKRVYEPVAKGDGRRILIDGLWPRGIKKGDPRIDLWHRGVAPSAELRRWFGHDPARWDTFLARFHAELDEAPEAVAALEDLLGQGPATLVFAARDVAHSNAEALRRYFEAR